MSMVRKLFLVSNNPGVFLKIKNSQTKSSVKPFSPVIPYIFWFKFSNEYIYTKSPFNILR